MSGAEGGVPDDRGAAFSANRDRLAEVYREYAGFLTRFVAVRLNPRDRHVAEDVAHETLIRAWPKLGAALEADGNLHKWLATIARGEVASYYTERGGAQHAVEDPRGEAWQLDVAAPRADDPPPAPVAGGGPSLLEEALAGLAPVVRRAVELRVAHGMSDGAAADVAGSSRQVAFRRARAGVASLRTQLAGVSPAEAVSTDPMVRAREAVAQAHRRVAEAAARAARPRPAAVAREQAALHGRLPTVGELVALGVAESSARGALRKLSEDSAEPQPCAESSEDPLAGARGAVAQAHHRVAEGAGRRAEDAAQERRVARSYAEDQAEDHAADAGRDAGRGAW